jgi:cyanophycinase
VGWYSDELGGDDYSVSNLYLDIIPVRMARPFTTPWAPH